MKFKFPIKECPYCGGRTIRVRQKISGTGEYYVDLKNGEVDSSELHSGLRYKNTRKYVTCADCDKQLFKVDDFLNVID